MFRNFFRLLIAILVVALVRYLFMVVSRAFSSGTPRRQESAGHAPPAGPPRAPASGGELHRDPVCGTFVSESASVMSSAGGATVYFCSIGCRDRYLADRRERKA